MTFDEFAMQLRDRSPLPPLFPLRVWNLELSRALTATPDDELFGELKNPQMAQLCRAGLLLFNDDLDAAHAITQKQEGDQTADYWHAILHRREGDASNARYWWRRVGTHPAFEEVYAAALLALRNDTQVMAQRYAALMEQSGSWQPEKFTEMCAASQNAEWLLSVQLAEMNALLNWCRVRVAT